ncbi:hypothetical protein, variant [Capsaspora owczarzaki ATCC 30864]|uniref:Sensor domain-containing protein n=1 Tax=Capsaspora owczarzaki (strain ATCC 30864) TaxID=595528 RepID=A0A0D2WXX3_CAPO3|nr:hypothetical protein, variant [Capsaspora owczarzaki ATCC 30864]
MQPLSSSYASGSSVGSPSNAYSSVGRAASMNGSNRGSGMWPARSSSSSFVYSEDSGRYPASGGSNVSFYQDGSRVATSSSYGSFGPRSGSDQAAALLIHPPTAESAPPPYSPAAGFAPIVISSNTPTIHQYEDGSSRCCERFVRFLLAPLHYHTWMVVFVILLASLPFTLVASVWCLVTLVLMVPLLCIFPIGAPAVTMLGYSWRALGRMATQLELFLYEKAGGRTQLSRVQAHLPTVEVRSTADGRNCWVDSFRSFKSVLGNRVTWASVMYLAFLRTLAVLVTVLAVVVCVMVPLALIFNFAVILVCDDDACWNALRPSEWGGMEDHRWIFTELRGSAVTAPVGLVLLIILTNLLLVIVRGFARIAFSLLVSPTEESVLLLSATQAPLPAFS